ncbi:MAG TPA: lipopolysaccharide biosynthesis protein RfbH [Candidatus Nanoarchaeia archaeon]|nr:lipopolysaccharide biosynthesis protein RfbH [Candidatus Nanoarchaeia archaeon]
MIDAAGNTKKQILELVKRFFKESQKQKEERREGSARVAVSGKVYDEKELQNLVECSLEGWWTEGRWNALFEKKLKDLLGMNFALTMNSGSSANLIALKCLTSPRLGERRIKRGDEVITTAACFPTTVNPIIDIGAIPVFIDVELPNYNASAEQVEKAITKKTKAVILAHTLGNPFDAERISELCKKHNLWLIEDNCDALGSRYNGRLTGTFGDLATLSFYPAHHMTTAEGGAVMTDNPALYKIARSMRDWGRDCWCPTGRDNTCGKRFEWKLGRLPYGYDHKYIYSEIGYNLKMTDFQAALGVAQIDKLEGFIEKRKKNFDYLKKKLKAYEDCLLLPEKTNNSDPSWFGFLITLRQDNPEKKLERDKMMKHLESEGIGTRLLFSGNITKQPYFIDYSVEHRQVGNLKNTDLIMNNSFWVGVYPGIDRKGLDRICQAIEEYLS